METMPQELRWSASRRRQEMRDAGVFMGVSRLGRARLEGSGWFGSGRWVGWWGADGTARRLLLSCAQLAPGEVELLKAARAGSVSDGRSKVDCEAARGAILEKLGVHGFTRA
jgi:hypothetical protein